jgi:hypothetical protein
VLFVAMSIGSVGRAIRSQEARIRAVEEELGRLRNASAPTAGPPGASDSR